MIVLVAETNDNMYIQMVSVKSAESAGPLLHIRWMRALPLPLAITGSESVTAVAPMAAMAVAVNVISE